MKVIFLFLSMLLAGCASARSNQSQAPFIPCQQDKVRLEARSKELQEIVKADQAGRSNWQNKSFAEMIEKQKKDESRRRRVGEIYGEGCFSKAEDYAAAALVYQHGDTPDHFFQTFIWSKRAIELGDPQQKRMMALGIDRYLISRGHKQLFGSQAYRPGATEETCWCLQQIEKSFPDKRRKEEAGKTTAEVWDWLKSLNHGKTCSNTECSTELKPSSKGTVPGYW